ncbi:MAG TPA: protealysin inhibitor emfourin [Pseudonocardiaceae bacterium]|nr:protealysin inhibitor emfourin [Pseudonocardiaceae bacterium]
MPGVHVRVELIRSGGFAGLIQHSCLDTETLSAIDARELQKIVERINFEVLGRPREDSEPMPDSFQYELTIIRGEEQTDAVLTERQITAELRPLIQFLDQRGRPC